VTASCSVAQIVGPALGATFVALVGAPVAILFDAASFVVSALLVARIRYVEPPNLSPRRPMWAEVKEGLALVWHTPMLRQLVWVVFLWIALNDGFNALYVLFASRELGLDASGIAVINTLGAFGGLLGALAAHRIEQRFGMRAALVIGVLLAATGYLLYAQPTRDLAYAAWFAGLAMMVVDAGAAIYVVNYLSLRQAVTPDALLGRVITTMRFLSISLTPLATVVIGRSGDVNGIATTLTGVGIGCVLLGLLAMRFLPTYRR
jgi:Na+/melibiose symporter-like transporter